MEAATQPSYFRQIAIKSTIQNILQGNLIQENDNPVYLLTINQQKLYRVNIMAIILSKEETGSITSFIIDDGTGKISLRYFEENKHVSSLQIGDVVLVIGKVRIYNEEKYLAAEITKKISSEWLKLRKKELAINNNYNDDGNSSSNNETVSGNIIIETVTSAASNQENQENSKRQDLPGETLKQEEEDQIQPDKKIIQIIKDLDLGDGVLIEDIKERSPFPETEQVLNKMLQGGEIYQITPGKIKVL